MTSEVIDSPGNLFNIGVNMTEVSKERHSHDALVIRVCSVLDLMVFKNVWIARTQLKFRQVRLFNNMVVLW